MSFPRDGDSMDCRLIMTVGRPFIIDLESTNGTFVNDVEIPKSRYYELRASDGKLWAGSPQVR